MYLPLQRLKRMKNIDYKLIFIQNNLGYREYLINFFPDNKEGYRHMRMGLFLYLLDRYTLGER